MGERGLDFADAAMSSWRYTGDRDTRKDHGEKRVICFGLLEGRMVVVGYTPRGADRHVFSMRKANEREKARIAPLLEV
ncbi:MAG: BrnT family toxin [Betaproteobacteria bacterium]|nr:BrnT family toxin [Betaproteobacteria bacterium]